MSKQKIIDEITDLQRQFTQVTTVESDLNIVLEARAKYLLEKLDLYEKYGVDDFPDGAVITFEKQFSEKTAPYNYAAIRIRSRWFISGAAAGALTWEELVEFWINPIPVKSIWYATHLDEVISIPEDEIPERVERPKAKKQSIKDIADGIDVTDADSKEAL